MYIRTIRLAVVAIFIGLALCSCFVSASNCPYLTLPLFDVATSTGLKCLAGAFFALLAALALPEEGIQTGKSEPGPFPFPNDPYGRLPRYLQALADVAMLEERTVITNAQPAKGGEADGEAFAREIFGQIFQADAAQKDAQPPSPSISPDGPAEESEED